MTTINRQMANSCLTENQEMASCQQTVHMYLQTHLSVYIMSVLHACRWKPSITHIDVQDNVTPMTHNPRLLV